MRLSRTVDTADIEIAVKLLRHTIFQEDMGLGEQYPEKEEEEGDQDMEGNKENKPETNSFAPRSGRSMGRQRVAAKPSTQQEPEKKQKPDHEE